MQQTTFSEIADLALKETGQAFQTSKSYLVEARLAAICRRENFSTLDELVHCLRSRPNASFKQEVAAALTDKLTRFFANPFMFEQIVAHTLPRRLSASKTGRLSVWCAGVSTGQEAYSLAMLLAELDQGPLQQAKIDLVATDVSLACIETAKAGIYGHFDVQLGLSAQRLLQYFQQQPSGDWQIDERFRQGVRFQSHNLLTPADRLGRFDVIICRNVLRNMGGPMQKTALGHILDRLLPGGVLFAGEDEDLSQIDEGIIRSRDTRGAWERRVSRKSSAAA